MSKTMIGTLAALAVVLVLVLGLFSYCNGLQREGVAMETALNAQYLDNQRQLSDYILAFHEQVGIANLKSDKMKEILEEAVKGRYDQDLKSGAPRGQLMLAIHEAYPDLDLKVYDQIMNHIRAGREAYGQKQSLLLDKLRAYDTWRNSGLVHSRMVSFMGFPSQNLKAQIGTKITRGQAALDQMYIIVLTKDAKDAYETGEQAPLVPGK